MTTSKKKSVKLNKVAQLDGKASEVKNLPLTLDALMGETINVYSASSVEEYRSQLIDMNQTDLQSHAYKIGIVPIEDRRVLVGRLVQEFERWYSVAHGQQTVKSQKSFQDLSAKAQKILREGA